jgi:adenine-specific DNA glycosylase
VAGLLAHVAQTLVFAGAFTRFRKEEEEEEEEEEESKSVTKKKKNERRQKQKSFATITHTHTHTHLHTLMPWLATTEAALRTDLRTRTILGDMTHI